MSITPRRGRSAAYRRPGRLRARPARRRRHLGRASLRARVHPRPPCCTPRRRAAVAERRQRRPRRLARAPARGIRIERDRRWVGEPPARRARRHRRAIVLEDGCPGGIAARLRCSRSTTAARSPTACGCPAAGGRGRRGLGRHRAARPRRPGHRERRLRATSSAQRTARRATSELEAGSGDVSGGFAEAPSSLRATAGSGDVSLRVPRERLPRSSRRRRARATAPSTGSPRSESSARSITARARLGRRRDPDGRTDERAPFVSETFAPLWRPRTYAAALYDLLAFPIGLAAFLLLVVGGRGRAAARRSSGSASRSCSRCSRRAARSPPSTAASRTGCSARASPRRRRSARAAARSGRGSRRSSARARRGARSSGWRCASRSGWPLRRTDRRSPARASALMVAAVRERVRRRLPADRGDRRHARRSASPAASRSWCSPLTLVERSPGSTARSPAPCSARRAREELARLAVRTEQAAARADLARELHDSVGHSVTAAVLQASAARRVLAQRPGLRRRGARRDRGAGPRCARGARSRARRCCATSRGETRPAPTSPTSTPCVARTRAAGQSARRSRAAATSSACPPPSGARPTVCCRRR